MEGKEKLLVIENLHANVADKEILKGVNLTVHRTARESQPCPTC